MASEPVARAVAEEVVRWGSMKPTGVSLRYMMEFGSSPTQRNLLLSAQFLQKELPIRIARRALELDSLPFGLSNKPAILKVRRCIPRLSLSPSLSLRINLANFYSVFEWVAISLSRLFVLVAHQPMGDLTGLVCLCSWMDFFFQTNIFLSLWLAFGLVHK